MGLYDSNETLVELNNTNLEAILSSDDVTVVIDGNTRTYLQEGLFTFTDIKIVAKPGYTTSLKVVASDGRLDQLNRDSKIGIGSKPGN